MPMTRLPPVLPTGSALYFVAVSRSPPAAPDADGASLAGADAGADAGASLAGACDAGVAGLAVRVDPPHAATRIAAAPAKPSIRLVSRLMYGSPPCGPSPLLGRGPLWSDRHAVRHTLGR